MVDFSALSVHDHVVATVAVVVVAVVVVVAAVVVAVVESSLPRCGECLEHGSDRWWWSFLTLSEQAMFQTHFVFVCGGSGGGGGGRGGGVMRVLVV